MDNYVNSYDKHDKRHALADNDCGLPDYGPWLTSLASGLAAVDQVDFLVDHLEGPQPQAKKAAVLVPLFPHTSEQELHVAFIRRSATMRAHSGEIAFPGGKCETDEAFPVETALREAQEEIGLDPARVRVLGLLNPVFTIVSNYVILPVVAFLPEGLGALHLQTSEVSEVIVASVQQLSNPAIVHTEQWLRDGKTRVVHFYQYGEYTIWGATGRILSEFLKLLPAE